MKPNLLDMFHGDNREQVPDFAKAKANGVAAVCHKATQGIDYTDPRYHIRQEAALKAGLIWGAYHFGDASPEIDQAVHFLAVAGSCCDFLVLDYEDSAQPMGLMQALVFMIHCDGAQGGKTTWLYSGNRIRETLTARLGGHVAADMLAAGKFFALHPLWLAEYGPVERVPAPWTKTIAWQYSETGSVAGVSGHVDLNAMDADAFRQRRNDTG